MIASCSSKGARRPLLMIARLAPAPAAARSAQRTRPREQVVGRDGFFDDPRGSRVVSAIATRCQHRLGGGRIGEPRADERGHPGGKRHVQRRLGQRPEAAVGTLDR